MERESRQNQRGENFPKLVRDKIPSIIRKAGENPVYHSVERDQFYFALRAKLTEEVGELLSTKTREGFIEEVADVMEVIEAMMNLAEGRNGISWKDIENMRNYKNTVKGRFTKKFILERVDKS